MLLLKIGENSDDMKMVSKLLCMLPILSGKEANFIHTLATWKGDYSPKQIEWVIDIYNRIFG
jgi:hypothetical protein